MKKILKQCFVCGVLFIQHSPKHIFCSEKCCSKEFRKKHRKEKEIIHFITGKPVKKSRQDNGAIINPLHAVVNPDYEEYQKQRKIALRQSPDLSQMIMIQVDYRTWIPKPPGTDPELAKQEYFATHKQ